MKILKLSLLTLVLIAFIYLYKTYNPTETNFFPSCPFKSLTGFQCPGCGSQRAIHHLLNFEIIKAFEKNPLLVLAIPYVLTGIVFDNIKNTTEKSLEWRKRLFGIKAIRIILSIVILFWIFRNIF